MASLGVPDIRDIADRLYKAAPIGQRLLSLGRPFICPFHVLVEEVPEGSSILDLGCGSGLFLNALAHAGRISRGVGLDSSSTAIGVAQAAAREQRAGSPDIRFECRGLEQGLPEGKFDVVSMIDVIHHVKPAAQRSAIVSAAAKVSANGLFLVKDIGARPRWRAWANRFHDLVLARQWINYISAERLIDWVSTEGFDVIHRETINTLWYGHELTVFRRSQ